MKDPFVDRARRRIFGNSAIGLTAEQVRATIRLGPDADDRWPRNVEAMNPTAAALANATRNAGDDPNITEVDR